MVAQSLPGRDRRALPIVAVFGDWDADGIIGSSVIVSSQKYGRVYPHRGEALVELEPVEPFRLSLRFSEIPCYDYIVVVDIPVIDPIISGMRGYKGRCSDAKIVYIDHHVSSHESLDSIYEAVDEPLIGYVPASRIALDRVVTAGYRPGDRLRSFVEAVDLMDRGARIPMGMSSLFKAVSSISKALTYKRDAGLWRRAVEWISSQVPLQHPIIGESMGEIMRLAEEAEKRIRDGANILAISSQKLGAFRYIDARDKWKERGASALASAIHRKLRAPVVLGVRSREEGFVLLIVKYPGKAYKVVRTLKSEGLAVSIGGHASLGIARVPEGALGETLELLRRISYSI